MRPTCVPSVNVSSVAGVGADAERCLAGGAGGAGHDATLEEDDHATLEGGGARTPQSVPRHVHNTALRTLDPSCARAKKQAEAAFHDSQTRRDDYCQKKLRLGSSRIRVHGDGEANEPPPGATVAEGDEASG